MSKSQRKKIRKRRVYGIRKKSYITLMIIIVCVYLVGQCFFDWERLTETIATIIAIIAAVAFWLEYHESKQLNEAQFIMDLNEQFISDQNLSSVEWELEKYYIKARKGELTKDFCKKFEENFDLENPKQNRQNLVNYRVHLEGIATLVDNGVIRLEAIDDLMSYRYFIAVNNPIVQKLELLEYPDYYKGCFKIYDDWVTALQGQHVVIPMYDKGKNNLSKKLSTKNH